MYFSQMSTGSRMCPSASMTLYVRAMVRLLPSQRLEENNSIPSLPLAPRLVALGALRRLGQSHEPIEIAVGRRRQAALVALAQRLARQAHGGRRHVGDRLHLSNRFRNQLILRQNGHDHAHPERLVGADLP